MWLDPRRYEIVDDAMVEVLRAKTPDEKLSIAEGMWRMARDLIRDMLRHDHPEWTELEIDRETARRMLTATLSNADQDAYIRKHCLTSAQDDC